MAILNNSNAISSGGYDINNSVRLRSSASAYLSRTPASAGTRTTWTWSGWVKRGALSISSAVISCGSYSTNLFQVFFDDSTNTLRIQNFPNSATPDVNLHTSQVFRDPSAWYHIVVAMDTTQATSSNRVKIYINGSQVTAFSTATYPAQNATPNWNTGSLQHNLGARDASTLLFDGYLAEVNFIDGSQKAASDFGETDTTTGSWKPKAYSSTYGTNGFYLKFSDIATTSGSNAGLGKDFSGNANYWTTNNISVTAGTTYDAMIDSPTLTSATVGNYATINPLLDLQGYITYSEGNLKAVSTVGSGFAPRMLAMSTFQIPTTGKWFWGYHSGDCQLYMGRPVGGSRAQYTSAVETEAVGYAPAGGQISLNGTTLTTAATATVSDEIIFAADMDALTVAIYKNGTLLYTVTGLTAGVPYYVMSTPASSSSVYTAYFNFGQRPFTYTPSGYKTLNTYNLPDSTIKKGSTVMDATTFTATSGAQSIVNAGAFKPDLVWVKSRSNAQDHYLIDSVRDGTKLLRSNTTSADSTSTSPAFITSFNSNGFSTDSASLVSPGYTYVGWQWQAGQGSTSSNTSGSITSTVSVNTTAGFSIVTYTGNGTAGATVGHGLGVAPKMIINKSRSTSSTDWGVYHASLGNTGAVFLDLTSAFITNSGYWNNTSPTSSVFTLGLASNFNQSGQTYVAYCWAEIAGFSKFGSYTGNGSTDGVFVYLGFRPKYVMIKCSSAAGNDWPIIDTSRATYNAAGPELYADLSQAESTSNYIDIVSNGFKIRSTGGQVNTSATTYIYMAFAENPFKNSLAR